MQFHFYKYQGTGNDFVLIDNRNLIFPEENSALVKHICDRRFGIGADGLMLLENTADYDFKMVYYNADGNESTMCGNGGRCISAFARRLGIVDTKGSFLAVDGGHEFIISEKEVQLKMMNVDKIQHQQESYILNTGSPHYVIFRNEIETLDIVEEARKIRYNDTYKTIGINVNFVQENNNQNSMRTYERGVEDETLSCGTGTVAVALAIAEKRNLNKDKIEILTPGGNLKVAFVKEGTTFTDIWLEGPAEFVFEGSINAE